MAIGNSDSISMAVFCDFENVALGVRDAQYEQFDIRPVLERLLVKGSIVVKKAYCDWERYKGFKNAMHEANFELIEIPHVRQSGKNSADIRLVVDALDLCYTKSHVDTFVIVSGDSDFSPLVSKLRENAKQVIGVGVKQSTSDLLIANCDEFIFYDDLVREQARRSGRQSGRDSSQAKRGAGQDDARPRREDLETRRAQALEIAMETYDALSSERGDGSKLWASVLKDAIKRRRRISMNPIMASAPSATCWKKRRRAACCGLAATSAPAPISGVTAVPPALTAMPPARKRLPSTQANAKATSASKRGQKTAQPIPAIRTPRQR